MDSELQGRLRNTQLPYHSAMIPLYEAVVNSIQSIEERCSVQGTDFRNHSITILVCRSRQQQLATGSTSGNPIEGFEIHDTGIGFTDDNWNSFNKLDSLHKIKKGCRGIGRLMWLKAFSSVEIQSTFWDAERSTCVTRNFKFDVAYNKDQVGDPVDGGTNPETTVKLYNFDAKYAAHPKTPKTLEGIATGLLEHILWYFIRDEGVPKITLSEAETDEKIDLSELLEEHMHKSAETQKFAVKGKEFWVTHCKIRASKNKGHALGYCAAGRLVKEEQLKGKLPGLNASISDADGEFSYAAYITGEFLNDRVFEMRVGFNIDEEIEGLFAETEISFKDIREAVLPLAKAFLGDALTQNLAAGAERLDEYVAKVAPGYRPILPYIPVDELAIDPGISDKDLDLLLHKHAYQVEQRLKSDGHDLMQPKVGESEDEYSKRLEQYLEVADDLKASDLAKYVMHRKVIIDLLEKAIARNSDGSYAREDVIHELIVPMQITSDDAKFKRQSLWLLDERLAFHNFLASDVPLTNQPITSNATTKEPDISCLKIYENPLLVADTDQQHASLTVVELKRPMLKGSKPVEDEKKDPILQALNYLRRLREGATAKNGRPIPNADKIPGYVYVLADLTPHMINCCDIHQLTKTADGMGYFGYQSNEKYRAYIQVVSFDGLVAGAKERNHAFFQHLGLPAH